ncbi:pre-mRNA cleavage complex 2 protein Pcf11-like isoform X2 [Corticium candelabrum]|uniref:pre-mRNA cleavage complex 2 protein Pcf11-like isoform X2 n=1 Tax=Corticium candelabrum TaxID=121492 RepID=UPI002E26F1A0|nr:pre-mRNA cleavage complex 2 protein Pcf11-like isoform X2 [Corticium candelabrum]
MADSESPAMVVSREYAASLKELQFNSKPQINALTIVADENRKHAVQIVRSVETRLSQVSGQRKMPLLYLLDSIVKNLGGDYIDLVAQNLVSTFCSAFEQADEQMRRDLFKLRQTWSSYFPTKKLHAIDQRVNVMDPNWPVTAGGPIHVNPKFISQEGNPLPDSKSKQASKPVPVPTVRRPEDMRPSRETPIEVKRRPVGPKEQALERRDQMQRVVEPEDRTLERRVAVSVARPSPVGHTGGDCITMERNRVLLPDPRGSPSSDDPRFKVSDAKRPRLDDDARDRSRYHVAERETREDEKYVARRDEFPSQREAMNSFHSLIEVPPEKLLDNENYILKQAEALLQSRYIEHEERQALFRLIKELHRQQTLQEERTYSAGVERRLAAPIPAPTRPPPPPEQRFAPAPLPSAPLPAPPPSGPPPRLLLKEEEDELLRKKQEDDRRRREEENERRMQERQMWNASSGAAGQTKVNGILRASEPADAAVRPHLANNVSELFQRLLQTGILSEAQRKSENNDYKSISSMQRPPLPDIKLVPSDLRELQNVVVVGLYSGQQCPTCGVRFVGSKSSEYSSHLDWHFKLKRREKANKIPTRKWMFPAEDWVKFIDYDNLEDTARSTVFDMEKEEVMTKEHKVESCPVKSEDEEVCPICHEAFEQFWEEDHEEWHFKDAVRISGIVYHVSCYEDAKEETEGHLTSVHSEQTGAAELTEKGSSGDSAVDANVEQQSASTSVGFESVKSDENHPLGAS